MKASVKYGQKDGEVEIRDVREPAIGLADVQQLTFAAGADSAVPEIIIFVPKERALGMALTALLPIMFVFGSGGGSVDDGTKAVANGRNNKPKDNRYGSATKRYQRQ